MRREFAKIMHEIMLHDEDVFLITADLGYGLFDKLRDDFPNRFINVGSAEQLMMLTAVGLSLSGKKVVTYTITPFYWRCAEMIRNYVDHEGIPVMMVGSGRGKDYAHDGFSHDATDDYRLFESFDNFDSCWPETELRLKDFEGILGKYPCYVNLKR